MSKYHLHLSLQHALTSSPLIFSISLMHFVFYCVSCPVSNFLPLFFFSKVYKHSQTCTQGKKKPLFCYCFNGSRSHTPTHAGCALIPLLFRRAKTQRARERRKKLSYRFELHTVSILPSLNDLNKESNTAGPE